MDAVRDPLTARVPAEVPLPRAPLIRVITQITFPTIVSIGKAEFIAPFQEALRGDYPALRPEQTIVFAIPPQQKSPQTTWRFQDEKNLWRVSLAQSFVALETTAYVSRADFIGRLTKVIDALAEHINPRVIDRVGTRYVDRVKGDTVNDLPKLIRPEIMGVMAMKGAAEYIQHALSESLFLVPPGKAQLLARWGRLPKGSTPDAAVIDPIEEPSWILDLDMFCAESKPFDKKAVVEEVQSYSERIYTFFRWAVTHDFLRAYGGAI